jgi:hypothetical protein
VDDDPATDRVSLVVGGTVSALLMPAELGAEVVRVLSIHLLAGPVIGYQSEGTWAFLTEPAGSGSQLPSGVAAAQVVAVRPGRRLSLPPSSPSPDVVRWINEPGNGCPKPPWQAVVSATRRVVELSIA